MIRTSTFSSKFRTSSINNITHKNTEPFCITTNFLFDVYAATKRFCFFALFHHAILLFFLGAFHKTKYARYIRYIQFALFFYRRPCFLFIFFSFCFIYRFREALDFFKFRICSGSLCTYSLRIVNKKKREVI